MSENECKEWNVIEHSMLPLKERDGVSTNTQIQIKKYSWAIPSYCECIWPVSSDAFSYGCTLLFGSLRVCWTQMFCICLENDQKRRWAWLLKNVCNVSIKLRRRAVNIIVIVRLRFFPVFLISSFCYSSYSCFEAFLFIFLQFTHLRTLIFFYSRVFVLLMCYWQRGLHI